jgi:hypothetical protein
VEAREVAWIIASAAGSKLTRLARSGKAEKQVGLLRELMPAVRKQNVLRFPFKQAGCHGAVGERRLKLFSVCARIRDARSLRCDQQRGGKTL